MTPKSQDYWRCIKFFTFLKNLTRTVPSVFLFEVVKLMPAVSRYKLMAIPKTLLIVIGPNSINN